MVGILPMALMLMLSGVGTPTDAQMIGNFGFGSFNINIDVEAIEKRIKEEKEHKEALERANWFTLEEWAYFSNALENELKSANAILLRNKDIFKRIREDDEVKYTLRTKTKKLFSEITKFNDIPVKEIRLYEFEPTRDWIDLAEFVWDTQKDTTTDKEEKREMVYHRIRDILKTLQFLKDACRRADAKRQETGYKKNEKVTFWDLIGFLSAADIRMAIAKHEKNWDYYDYVAKILDEL